MQCQLHAEQLGLDTIISSTPVGLSRLRASLSSYTVGTGGCCLGVKQWVVKLSTPLSLEPTFICKIHLHVLLTRLHGVILKYGGKK